MSFAPGDIAVVDVQNRREQARSGTRVKPKPRPSVIAAVKPDGWVLIAGLTSLSHFGDGAPRTAYHPSPCTGLTAAGYLWGGKLVAVPASAVGERIGRINEDLGRKVIAAHSDELDAAQIAELWMVASGVAA